MCGRRIAGSVWRLSDEYRRVVGTCRNILSRGDIDREACWRAVAAGNIDEIYEARAGGNIWFRKTAGSPITAIDSPSGALINRALRRENDRDTAAIRGVEIIDRECGRRGVARRVSRGDDDMVDATVKRDRRRDPSAVVRAYARRGSAAPTNVVEPRNTRYSTQCVGIITGYRDGVPR